MPSSLASVLTVMVLQHPGGPASTQTNNVGAKEQSMVSTSERQLTAAEQHLIATANQAHDVQAASP